MTLKSNSTDPCRPKQKKAPYLYGRTYPHGNKQRRVITQIETEIEADPEAQVETVKEILRLRDTIAPAGSLLQAGASAGGCRQAGNRSFE